jgi:hypothetical protein
MSRPSYNPHLGADGITGDAASGIVDATSPTKIPWSTLSMIDPLAGADVAAAGDQLKGLRPPLRYLLIQPRGGSVEVRLGNQAVGVIVADGDRYTLPGIAHEVTLDNGPEIVYIEAGW